MIIVPTHHKRKGHVKLFKDLKHDKMNLRQSLLEMSEFEDMQKVYESKKHFYWIKDEKIKDEKQKTEENEEQIQQLLSPEQRIEMYRKEKINKKFKEKLNKIYEHKEAKMSHVRKPKTQKLLDDFQNKYRNQTHISLFEQLRESQINLENMKKNNKRTFKVSMSCAQPHKNSIYSKNSFKNNENEIMDCSRVSSKARSRFLSLKTGLPQKHKQKFVYQPVKELMLGISKKSGDEDKFQGLKGIDQIYSQFVNHKNPNQLRVRIPELDDAPLLRTTTLRKKPISSYIEERVSQKTRIDHSFNISEQSSKGVIETMSQFYESKHSKKTQFDEMTQNLKHDRPLTSNIRRRNYKIIGKSSLSSIAKYRYKSEQERVLLLKKNYEFYMQLVEKMMGYHIDDVPTSIFIIQELKEFFENQYELTEEFFDQLHHQVSQMPDDICVSSILRSLKLYVKDENL